MNILNFAHGQMFMIGGFATYYVYGQYHMPFVVGLLAATLGVGVIGVLFDILFFRRLRHKATREENTILLAVGTALLLENVALFVFGEKERGVPDVLDGVLRVGDAFLPESRILVLATSVALVTALLLFVYKTRTGRAMRALAQDREATLLMGVDVERISALGFGHRRRICRTGRRAPCHALRRERRHRGRDHHQGVCHDHDRRRGRRRRLDPGRGVLGFAEAIGYALIPGSVTYLMIFVGLIIFLVIRPQGVMGKPWG